MPEYRVKYEFCDDGWIMATVPALPGAISQGRTMDEAREMIKDAIAELLASYEDDARNGDAVWETVQVGA